MGYTKLETLGDVWSLFKQHGLEGKYCPHCDQFSQARVLLKQDRLISDLYEALKIGRDLASAYLYLHPDDEIAQAQFQEISKALAKARVK